MSTIHNNPKIVRVEAPRQAAPPSACVNCTSPAAGTIVATIRLTVVASRRALLNAFARATPSTLFDAPPALASRGEDVHIVFEIAPDGTPAISLIDPVSTQRFALRHPGTVERTLDGDFIHLDSPGLLAATIRSGDPSARPLFLRSPIMAALGLGGGRYEVL